MAHLQMCSGPRPHRRKPRAGLLAILIVNLALSWAGKESVVMAQAAHNHPHHAELVNPDGSWKYTNRLSKQTSPYLLQHAHNPVDWHPWGPEAFELSRKLNKPIFLSVGYSTCYWCHVMERQVFENPAIAKLMNEHFINVKVDREERPDVDDIYMVAVQVMTGRGGWPMSVFLTPPGTQGPEDPGLKPFYAGTYFPPEPMHGMPGFPQILTGLSKAWDTKRDEIIEQAVTVAESVEKHLAHVDDPGELSVQLVQNAANSLLRSYDKTNAGFGDAPKFPTPTNLLFLIRVYQNNKDPELWKPIAHTLQRMAIGGMYDQVGGGFHRYSTDEQWLVPHFEKMLYDNGLLAETYALAQQTNPDLQAPTFYGDIARETCDYVLREMTDGSGAFWSAQDAEVDTMEGKSYLWLPAQVTKAIGSTDQDLALANHALKLYGLNKGTNFKDPHHHDAPPQNVLYLPLALPDYARANGITLEEAKSIKKQIDAKLLAARNTRKQPSTDDKILVAWNGMMIAGMARTGQVLSEPRYTQAAGRAADAILKHMSRENGRLYRTMRNGQAQIPAFLDDYSFFIHGLLTLHQATGEARWLSEAQRLVNVVNEDFTCPAGGYFDTLKDQKDLFVRTRSTYDGATPTGNSQMAHNLLTLAQLTAQDNAKSQAYYQAAAKNLRSFGVTMKRNGQGMTHMHQALLRALEMAPEGAVAQASPAASKEKRRVLEVGLSTRDLDTSSGPAELILTIDIGEDYHLNGPDARQHDMIPTELLLTQGDGLTLKVEYPEPKVRKFEFADRPVGVYEGQITIKATLTGKALNPGKAALVLKCQVCTEMSCLEPREYTLPVTIR